jgi:hypothetical protein
MPKMMHYLLLPEFPSPGIIRAPRMVNDRLGETRP